MGGSRTLTATFLFTDIEASSALWEDDPQRMGAALAIHDVILRKAIEACNGELFKHSGDGACAAFASAVDALTAAVDAQRAVHEEEWDLAAPLKVRMGIHTGEAEHRDGDYFGVALNRVARLHALASGGQIVVSNAARAVLYGALPVEIELLDLGEAELRGLAGRERVFQVTHPDLPGAFPPLVPVAGRGNVPVPPNDMTGRERELGQVLGLLGLGPLVTITGFGGVGKSRLALAAAPAAAEFFPDGAWWVELTPVPADAVYDAVAHSLGAHRQGHGPLDAIVDQLRNARALLLLDSCEHVLEPARALVETTLARCREVTILATSRAPLGLDGERTLALHPLGAPDRGAPFEAIAASPSVDLFERRARQVDPQFQVTAANSRSIAEICAHLDGLPLAIELAAARTRSMSPSEVLSRLDARFRLLRSRDRGLAQVVDWSYDLLSEGEQVLFEQLSVFRGRFSAAAATAVADPALEEFDVLDLLDGLVTQSLVEATVSDESTHYSLLETLRAFGRDRLRSRGESDLVMRRYGDYFVDLATQATAGTTGPEEAVWVERLDDTLADIRTTFEEARDASEVDTCLRLVVALAPYAFWRLRVEIADWAAHALALPGAGSHPLHDDVAGVAASLFWARGDADAAARYSQLGAPTSESSSWYMVDARGTVALFSGAVAAAIEAYASSADLAAAAGDAYRLALSRSREALAHVYAGLDDARDLAVASEQAASSIGNPTAMCVATWTAAIVTVNDDRQAALIRLQHALELAEGVGNIISAGSASDVIAQLHTGLERHTALESLRDAVEQIEYWARAGTLAVQWGMVRKAVRALLAAGKFDDAAVIAGAEQRVTTKMPLRPGEADRHAQALVQIRAALGDDDFERLHLLGADLDEADLIARLHLALEDAS